MNPATLLRSILSGPLAKARQTRKRLSRSLRLQAKVLSARRRRTRSDAVHVGVTGSSGKTTTAALLAHILQAHGQTESQIVYNNIDALLHLLCKGRRSTAYFVAETGVGGKGQMAPMAALLRPNLAIVTMVNNEHYSAFRGRDEVAAEKGSLVQALEPGGLALLNGDDPHVMSMAARTKERVVTFARNSPADYRVAVLSCGGAQGLAIEITGPLPTLRLQAQFLAEHFWLPCAAAAVAALELGVPADLVRERVADFEGLPERFQMVKAKQGPRFIVDTAKAPWDTLPQTIEAMGKLEARRKRIVLGHISDYAGNPNPKYRDAYRAAAGVADQVIFVGENAHRSRASLEDRESGRFLAFRSVREVSEYLHETASQDDLILLKTSRAQHLERVVLSWGHEVNCWQESCGRGYSCMTCGLYGHAFAQHAQLKRARRRGSLTRWMQRYMERS